MGDFSHVWKGPNRFNKTSAKSTYVDIVINKEIPPEFSFLPTSLLVIERHWYTCIIVKHWFFPKGHWSTLNFRTQGRLYSWCTSHQFSYKLYCLASWIMYLQQCPKISLHVEHSQQWFVLVPRGYSNSSGDMQQKFDAITTSSHPFLNVQPTTFLEDVLEWKD